MLHCLRTQGLGLGSAQAGLEAAGFWAEAAVLSSPGLLSKAEQLVCEGQVLSAACPEFPRAWRSRAFLGPPALWKRGAVPCAPLIALVGSRRPCSQAEAFAEQASSLLFGSGYSIVSGGAHGIDSLALAACPPGLAILPFGIRAPGASAFANALSPSAPDEGFSSQTAMERNVLLYAMACFSLAVQPRFKHGGTWHGAAEALRRRLCPVGIASAFLGEAFEARSSFDDSLLAVRALIGLGAVEISSPAEALAAAASAASGEPVLGAFCSLKLAI